MARNFAACETDAQKTKVGVEVQSVIVEMGAAIWAMDWATRPLLVPEKSTETPSRSVSSHRAYDGSENLISDCKESKANRSKRKAKQKLSKKQLKRQRKKEGQKRRRDERSLDMEMDVGDASARARRAERFKRSVSVSAATTDRTLQALARLRREAKLGTVVDWDAVVVKGTCTILEKSYYRLNEAPDPSVVRPLAVLEKAVEQLQKKYASGEKSYGYINNQFKAVRQDLKVQHIKNPFTVFTYETHARICLEHEDIPEVNQCQTQLHELYASGLQGNVEEFTAYRILYNVYINEKYRHGAYAMRGILLDASAQGVSGRPAVIHALQVRSAVEMDDCASFFRLYRNAPNMSKKMMSLLVDRMRHAGVRLICRAFRPSVDLEWVFGFLGFDSRDACVDYLLSGPRDESKSASQGQSLRVGEVAVALPGEKVQQGFSTLSVTETGTGAADNSDISLTGVQFLLTRETLALGHFKRPFVFKVMDGDSVRTVDKNDGDV